MSLGRRFVRAGLWVAGAHTVVAALLVVRSVLLARLLPVDVFGVYAFAAALTTLTAVIARFGMDDALVHRAPETRDAEAAASVHFTLAILFAALWAALMLTLALTFRERPMQAALVVLTGAHIGLLLAATPTALLRRRLDHQLLATIGLVAAIVSTAVGLTLAWRGYGLWALLLVDAVTSLLGLAALLIWGPVWRPRLRWDAWTVRYFLSFGSRNVLAHVLEHATQSVDKLWTGAVLGSLSLGFYARASAYSRASVGLVDRPLSSIAMGAYAELAQDRAGLSGAAMRICEILVHASALLTTVVGVTAPALIELLIGAKWLPMVDPFRILLIAAVPATLGRNCIQLLVGAGAPGSRVRIAALRLVALGLGLLVFGPRYGVTGVALAVLGATVAGVTLSLHCVSRFADLGLRTLLVPPVAAAAVAMIAATLAGHRLPDDAGLWARMILPGGAAIIGYGVVLVILRGGPFRDHLRFILTQLRPADEKGQA
jgi:O-antigen/teichoic acid export membrane protein